MLTYLHVANINYLIMIGIDLVPMGGGGEAIFSQISQKAISEQATRMGLNWRPIMSTRIVNAL